MDCEEGVLQEGVVAASVVVLLLLLLHSLMLASTPARTASCYRCWRPDPVVLVPGRVPSDLRQAHLAHVTQAQGLEAEGATRKLPGRATGSSALMKHPCLK